MRYVGHVAFGRARRYILISVALALAAGLIAFGLCWWADLPAPVVLSVFVGALSIVPGFGIMLGALPALLLASGLQPGVTTSALAVAFLAIQVAHELVQRRHVYRRSVIVGPAAIVITMIVGFEIYGIGGAFYGAALAVFAMAALDAAGDRELAR